VGRYPSQPVSVLSPHTNDLPNGPHTMTLMAQANFEPTFSCIYTLTILKSSYYSSYRPAYEDGIDRVFRNVGIQNSDSGELPRRNHTTFATWRKFEINNTLLFVITGQQLCLTVTFVLYSM
jgi:hypothetical protein